MPRRLILFGTIISFPLALLCIRAWLSLGNALEWHILGGACSPGLMLVLFSPFPTAFGAAFILGVIHLWHIKPQSIEQARSLVLKEWPRSPQFTTNPTWSEAHAFFQ